MKEHALVHVTSSVVAHGGHTLQTSTCSIYSICCAEAALPLLALTRP